MLTLQVFSLLQLQHQQVFLEELYLDLHQVAHCLVFSLQRLNLRLLNLQQLNL